MSEMAKWIFIPSKEPQTEDDQYVLENSNVYIQDSRRYTGNYVVGISGEDYIQEIGFAKTLEEAKKIGEKTCTFS